MIPTSSALQRVPLSYKDVAPRLSQDTLDALSVRDEMDATCEFAERVKNPSYAACTVSTPCWRWGCKTCEVAYAESPTLQAEANAYLESGEGRLDIWCAEQSRLASSNDSPKDSTELT